MIEIRQGVVPPLDAWGTVADLGAEIVEGEVRAFGTMLVGTPADALSCAYFACTKGMFRMVYPYTEHAVVIEGSATLTDETSGNTHTYGVGDAWFVEKGTPVLWDVHSERFIKNYLAIA